MPGSVRRYAVYACAAVCVLSRAAAAQDLVTDRPDFTESSEVVGTGRVQFETGLSIEADGQGPDHVRDLTLPSSLVRIGLSSRVELRLSSDGFTSERQGPAGIRGLSDVEVGAKVKLLQQDRAGFDMAIIPMASLPTGAASFSEGVVVPTLKLTWARSLPAGVDLSGNYNMTSAPDQEGRYLQQAVSLSMAHDLPRGFGGYFEAYGFTPMGPGQASGWTLNGGVSHALGANAQLDVEAGRGVTADAPDWFVGFGFAVRGWFRGRP